METARAERYLDKIDHARERLENVSEWSPRARQELHWKLATYKAFQESAEAISDLLAMAVVDSGHAAKDDYRNIDQAVSLDVISEQHADILTQATGLRNRLVHEYETLDDEIALVSMEELVGPMRRSLEEVTGWLKSRN